MERKSKFFLTLDEAREFEYDLRHAGVKDVLIVTKVNAEDVARGNLSGVARTGGADVHWTVHPAEQEGAVRAKGVPEGH